MKMSSMMGSLTGTISEQITNLSAEAPQETQSPAIRRASTDSISAAHPKIAVVGSSLALKLMSLQFSGFSLKASAMKECKNQSF
jgi:hypothetical protein